MYNISIGEDIVLMNVEKEDFFYQTDVKLNKDLFGKIVQNVAIQDLGANRTETIDLARLYYKTGEPEDDIHSFIIEPLSDLEKRNMRVDSSLDYLAMMVDVSL